MRSKKNWTSWLMLALVMTSDVFSQTTFEPFSGSLKWRMIGPYRAGRTVGAVGVPSQPNVFYIGVNNGGVWKTNDYGRTWNPIFDEQATGSIGDVVVSPSNPNVLYVASGEGLQRPDLSVGDGVYKSTDGGKTWINTGLREGQQIGGLAIDPKNENRVFAAVLGRPYGANAERGVYRTIDGGKSWEKVLYKDENTGAIQVTIDPKNSDIIYADLWASRLGPWENGSWQGTESGLFKSVDGGKTWNKLTKGLPTSKEGLGRIGFCIAPSDPNRLYATVDSKEMGGIYRSDDAGDSWIRTADDERYWGRGSDFAEVKVDPINADIVYTANVALWKSIDGGKTWNGFRGAPGGDDYHRIWINPEHPEIMLLAADQGAIITVNGGETFSSWYNQPTAQFYHVITDNEFPYNVYGGQQESGSACVSSRSFDGAISYRDWRPVGVEEWGYLAPDPLDPNIIYGGKLTRYDKRTGQTQSIEPYPNGKYQPNKSPWRFLRTAPLIFSPIDKKTLYYAGNVLFKTTSGGMSWDVISPDLSRETFEVPSNIGVYKTDEMKKMPRRGVIYTIAPSPKDVNLIWVGTDDGLIHKTSDGAKTWKNVTPQAITAWSKISLMEAGHFDPQTAYAAVNRIRLDDMKPHIYKTHDGGKTWTEIVKGLPNDPINVVREDHLCKGLLFAGSERAVYYSVDDGENWQSLRNNMPATSIRDLVIKDDDLVVGTHGRSFWILDNITSLRQLTTESMKSEAILFAPQLSYRVRWNTYTDTPIPHEEPAGENPPDGAILDYFIKDKANGVVTLEILDANNELICRYNSDDKPYEISTINHPKYWIRRQTSLSADAGSHRFVWDMKYTRLDEPASYGMSAVHMNTPPESTSPLVMPGQYQVRLTVNGKVYSQSLRIQMDPRVKTSTEDLKRQWELSMTVYTSRVELKKVKADLTNKQLQVKSLQVGAKGKWIDKLKEFQTKLTNFESSQKGSKLTGINNLSDSWATIFGILQDNDNPPTNQAALLVKDNKLAQTEWLAAWDVFKAKEILSFNELLRKDGMRVIE